MTFTRLHRFAETWLVDLAAALFTGFTVWWMEYSLVFRSDPIDSTDVRRLSVKLVAFVIPAMALSFWKHRLRIHWGWIVIAILGIILTSVVDEMIYRATATPEELSFMPAFSPFPLEIVMWVWQALFVMAAAHYLGRFFIRMIATQQIVGPERRERVLQPDWSGEG